MTKNIKERWRQFAAWVNGADSDTPVVTPEEKRAARPHPLRFLHGMLSEKNEMRVYHIFSVVMCLVFTGTLLLTVLFLAPLQVGYYNTFNRLYQEGNTDIVSNLFTSGFRNWGHIVGGQLLMAVYIFLWCLLLIVPGIVKAYSYAMTPYILVDRPELSANEAISLPE